MRIPVALFPFGSHLMPAVKLFEEMQDKYMLTRLISPSGFGLTGKDAGYSRNHPKVGITVTDTLNPTEPTWDVLLLIRTPGMEAIEESELDNAAEGALQSGKSVLYFGSSAGVPNKLWDLSEAYPGMVDIYVSNRQISASIKRNDDEYINIDVPVVLVGGLVEEADTFEVLLQLAARLRVDGFHVTALTRQPFGGLFGLHTLNHILDSRDKTEAEKILELNRFVGRLEARERPDIILMEAPDAVMRYNSFALNGFGIRTYMLCQGVRPDYFVCCVPCELAVGQFLDAISSDFVYRLGSPIHAVHVSNVIIDSMDLVQTRSISYVHADLKAVREQIATHGERSSIPFFDIVGTGVEGLHTHLRSTTGMPGDVIKEGSF